MKFVQASIIFASVRSAIATNGLPSDDNNIDQRAASHSIFDDFRVDFLRGNRNAMDFVEDNGGNESMVRSWNA